MKTIGYIQRGSWDGGVMSGQRRKGQVRRRGFEHADNHLLSLSEWHGGDALVAGWGGFRGYLESYCSTPT